MAKILQYLSFLLVVHLSIDAVAAGYFSKASEGSSGSKGKYLKLLKSSQLLGSSSQHTPRYMASPYMSHSSHATPYSSYSRPTSHSQLLTSASESRPTRIIIVRQPHSSTSKKTYSHSTVQYLPSSTTSMSSVVPTPYGYPSQQPQAPATYPQSYYPYSGYPMNTAASAYAPQMASPYASPYSPAAAATSYTPTVTAQNPLIASMIAAAQRVTQGHNYGYRPAASYMTPSYYPSPAYAAQGAMPSMYSGYPYAHAG